MPLRERRGEASAAQYDKKQRREDMEAQTCKPRSHAYAPNIIFARRRAVYDAIMRRCFAWRRWQRRRCRAMMTLMPRPGECCHARRLRRHSWLYSADQRVMRRGHPFSMNDNRQICESHPPSCPPPRSMPESVHHSAVTLRLLIERQCARVANACGSDGTSTGMLRELYTMPCGVEVTAAT